MSQIFVYLNKKTESFVDSKRTSPDETNSMVVGRLMRELAEQNEMKTKFDLREGK